MMTWGDLHPHTNTRWFTPMNRQEHSSPSLYIRRIHPSSITKACSMSISGRLQMIRWKGMTLTLMWTIPTWRNALSSSLIWHIRTSLAVCAHSFRSSPRIKDMDIDRVEKMTNYGCLIGEMHHIEMQKSSRQGHVHEHIYATAGHQTGNRSRGAWRTTSTMGRAQATETIPWQPRHDAEKDKGGKVADRHHVRLPLGWMDGRTWYQLATLLSRSYCMVSSNVSRTKHVKGDGMWYT